MISKNEKVDQLVALAFRILLSGAIFLALMAWFFGWEILNLRYSELVDEATLPFQLLMFCFVAIASNYIFGTLLTANGSLKALNIIAFTGMLMNIILNYILIPKYEVVGCAMASLITQIFTSLAQFVLATKKFSFRVNIKLIVQFSIYIVFMYGVLKLLRTSDLSTLLQAIFAIVFFLVFVMFSGIVGPRSIRDLLKEH
jgi:Na+-driven multidrug efflux pump